MIIKKDIKIKILVTILFLVALAIIILPAYFNRNKSYACTIQFVDSVNGKVVMSFDATCKDDGQETERDPYYTHRVYSFETYSVEKEKQQNDTIHENTYYNMDTYQAE
ncbi:hypothetical protein [Sphingobacterium yanglingense]|uniref:Uncharacterized protein n=1 Tax=Sphingobacterium yanglingense TaxID=1437280 RepID=A0A4R6WIM8_9SPHI|nr:hypothetical protein [Sphingobacterium yanglingense]TDQ80140.1 hypothetical protein CLV99_1595 [Sphingobacterium yanglingense]